MAAVTELQTAKAAQDAVKIQMIQQFMTNIVGYCRLVIGQIVESIVGF